jgi:D-tyrosyl-tRNA(Tyr) deacylase
MIGGPRRGARLAAAACVGDNRGMRAVVQRVSRARVTVGDRQTGAIGPGLLVLLGAGQGDTTTDLQYIVDKVAHLRIFADDAGKMNRSVLDVGGGVLLVSQFTLYGDARQGRRPAFIAALEPVAARALYEQALIALRQLGVALVQAGEFAADMAVELVNDGPVTILLDSRKGF